MLTSICRCAVVNVPANAALYVGI